MDNAHLDSLNRHGSTPYGDPMNMWTSPTPLLDEAIEAIKQGDDVRFIAKMVQSSEAEECSFKLDHPTCRANEIYARAGGDTNFEIHTFLVELYAGKGESGDKRRVESLLAHPRFREQRSVYAVPVVRSQYSNASSRSSSQHASSSSTESIPRDSISSAPAYRAAHAPAQSSSGGLLESRNRDPMVLVSHALEAIRHGDLDTFIDRMLLSSKRSLDIYCLNGPGCFGNVVYARAGGDSNPAVHDFLVGLYALERVNGDKECVERVLASSSYRKRREALKR